jgi:hypothetical protein
LFTIQDYIRMLRIENSLIKTQTQGLSQAESLLQPQPSGNCMNWVLGHTLDNQIIILKLLGGESPVDQAELAIYPRESEPVTADGPGVLPLELLVAHHGQVYEALAACLSEMCDEDFAREVPLGDRMVTLSWRIFFLHFHYTYHIGQLELLRQMAGHSEKLI